MPVSTKQKILLAFIGAGVSKIDPIRIMKGMFIIAKKTPEGWWPASTRYDFIPYSYGPCSFEIYSDLELLERLRLIQTELVPGQSWKYYSVTRRGTNFLNHTSEGLSSSFLGYIETIREFVQSLSFRSLLEIIYKNYPAYATNSVFQF